MPKADTVDLSQGVLYAQPIVNGFLVNSTPKVVMKVFKTSSSTCLIAMRNQSRVFNFKGQSVVFEYYQNDKLISEK
jgi:hypothetical protein